MNFENSKDSKVSFIKIDRLDDFFEKDNSLIVVDENTSSFVSDINDFSYVELSAGEAYKSWESISLILQSAVISKLDRNSTFISIGGGVLSDMTGFAASIYMRGCKSIYIPTTLLSMVDASIGGKTGIDFMNYKNLVGAFKMPEEVFIDVSFLKTLPDLEFKSGLGEVIKTAMLGDRELFNTLLENSDKVLARDEILMKDIVKRCIEIKRDYVKKDPLENGIRAHLNLGHTFGHALESIMGLGKVTHGEAVVWGINKALLFSSLEDTKYYKDFIEICELYGYNLNIEISSRDNYIEALTHDKKNIDNKIRVILQRGICDTYIKKIELSDLDKIEL